MTDNATQAIIGFLRHLNAKDLTDSELFEAKAATFERMAEEHESDPAFAAECREVAARARRRVLR